MAYVRVTAGAYLAIYNENDIVEIKAKSFDEARNIANWYKDDVKMICKIPHMVNYIGDLKIGYDPEKKYV